MEIDGIDIELIKIKQTGDLPLVTGIDSNDELLISRLGKFNRVKYGEMLIAEHEGKGKKLPIQLVSGSLLRSKAKEYAKFKHQDEYDDPIYHRDVLETLNDFEAGYRAAIKDCNDR